METYQVPMPNEGAHDKVLTRADFEKERDTLQAQVEALQVRYDDVTSKEHSIPELRKQLWGAFDEKQKCYAAVNRYQIANQSLIDERDALQAQVEALKHRVRVHLANRFHYSHADFCDKLQELMQEQVIDAAVKGGEA